jgi:hypothetical protein
VGRLLPVEDYVADAADAADTADAAAAQTSL